VRTVRVYLLGPVDVTRHGREIQLSGHHQRALIAALASEVGKVVSAERLIDTLWGEQPPATARNKLQGYVSGLRKALTGSVPGDARARWPLVTRYPGYLLSPDDVTVDLFDYRALLRLANREQDAGEFAAASRHLTEALGLWRGPAYADVNTPVFASMAAALERGRLLAIERRAECDLRLGRYDTVAEELTMVLATHPLREATRAALMLALYRRGCRAEALESYRAVRGLLREQLGIEPGQPLRRLHALMLDDDPELATQDVLADIIAASPPAALGRVLRCLPSPRASWS
jgi:DNA-binding SARP family transcriptional activator